MKDQDVNNLQFLKGTSTPAPNQVVGRYVGATLTACQSKKYVILRYTPREPRMINLDTTTQMEMLDYAH